LEGGEPGPTVLISALIHGNELCGAVALDHLLSSAFIPDRGRLILAFANVSAFARFDSTRPYMSRFIDEDMNRLWSPEILNGPGDSAELSRARALRPLAEAADYLLDLHSTSLPAPAMLLSGAHEKGKNFARRMGYPSYVVADTGHLSGVRLRDFGDFDNAASEKCAMLVECGQHFDSDSPTVALKTIVAFLLACGLLDDAPRDIPLLPRLGRQQFIEVSHTITIRSDRFAFDGEFQCFEIIPNAGTAIAHDGTRKIITPYDDCVLVMPARQPIRGQTAVRLGRFVPSG
jgi:predicted deacylase